MTRILITGGNGYIASSLYRELHAVYDITRITRNEFDLTNHTETSRWFDGKYFDVVIHTAITGGSRLRAENSTVIDNNLKMYYNLLDNGDKFDKFISIGSGAELYHTDTPYGLSKRVIHESMSGKNGYYNIRVFAVFDENELDTRFIKSNILRYIRKEPMIIHSNKQMSFFYMKDFIQVINHYITTPIAPKEFDCVYNNSLCLTEIANLINSLSDYTVKVQVESQMTASPYVGVYNDLGIKFDGFENGIRNVYKNLRETQ
jgi:nucleoside-diphosphate-sugar epimerase